jgi:hypothetical protein
MLGWSLSLRRNKGAQGKLVMKSPDWKHTEQQVWFAPIDGRFGHTGYRCAVCRRLDSPPLADLLSTG